MLSLFVAADADRTTRTLGGSDSFEELLHDRRVCFGDSKSDFAVCAVQREPCYSRIGRVAVLRYSRN